MQAINVASSKQASPKQLKEQSPDCEKGKKGPQTKKKVSPKRIENPDKSPVCKKKGVAGRKTMA